MDKKQFEKKLSELTIKNEHKTEPLAVEWISVSERLPEINVDVIVTDTETTGTYSAYYMGNGFWECDNGTFKDRIIAWQPFPEPYKTSNSAK